MSRERHSYIRFYPADWIGGTARLTRDQRSAYFEVCLYNWDKGEAMPRVEQELVFADLPNAQKVIDTLLRLGKIKRTRGGGLASDRALIEARSSRDRWEIASNNGAKGAKKRWQNKGLDSDPISTANGEVVTNQNQNQNQNQNTPHTPQGGRSDFFDDPPDDPPPAEGYSAAFEAWWSVYPNKTGKRAAFNAYERAFKRLGGAKAGTAKVHAKLRLAAEAQAKVWRRKGVEGRYIPHPTTWLNQSRWDDAEVVKELDRGTSPTKRLSATDNAELAPAAPAPAKAPCGGCGAPWGPMHEEGCSIATAARLRAGWTPADA